MIYPLPEDGALRARGDLVPPTRAVLKEVRRLLRGCKDTDVIFVPVDPLAQDSAAASQDEMGIAWTLGHIIAHTTASAEESAALAAALARGAPVQGRSRYETPWQTVTTVRQCQSRLEESRRMRLASLDMWPDRPDFTLTQALWEGGPELTAIQRYMAGLRHETGHLDQIRDVVTQAQTYRRRQTWWWRLFHPRARRMSPASLPHANEARMPTTGPPEASLAPAVGGEGIPPAGPELSDDGAGDSQRSTSDD